MPMPGPTIASVTHNAFLTNVSLAHTNPDYIAEQVIPELPVDRPVGLIPRYLQSAWFRDQAGMRAPGTRSDRGGFGVDSATYTTRRYSFGFELPDELRDAGIMGGGGYNLEQDGTRFVTDKILMKKEVLLAATAFVTGVWTGGSTVDPTGAASAQFVQFSTYATSDPLLVIDGYMNGIEALAGRMPNKLVMGPEVFSAMKWHPDILDVIKYTQRGMISTDLLSSLLGIQVIVGRALRVTSAEGVAEASATYARIWGKSILMLYSPPAPSMMEPAGSYMLTWNRVPNSSRYVKTMRDEEQEKDIIEGNGYFIPIIFTPRSGLLMQAVVA